MGYKNLVSRLGIGVVFAALSTLANAQTKSGNIADSYEDTIIVVGSRIPRPDAIAASPVASFDRNALNKFPELNVEEFLQELPQFTPDFSRASNNPGDGTATLNLRGLGADRTLILLNGRRLAPASTGTAVDVNVIPNVLIERIEVVTGGASAVYGSDAVTGAVNFVTRKNLEGVEIAGQFDIYGAGDGESYNMSIAAGTHFADGRGHISVYGDFLRRTPVRGGDREFTQVTLSEDFVTGEIVEGGSFRIPEGIIFFPQAMLDGALIFPVFTEDGSIRPFQATDTFNFAPDTFLQTPLDRWSGGVFTEYEVRPDFTLYSELMYSRTSSDQELASVSGALVARFSIDSEFFADSTREALRDAYDPDGDGVGQARLARRFEEVGPRRVARSGDYWRGVTGIRFQASPNWLIDAHYSYSRTDVTEAFENDVSIERLLQGLLTDPATGACVDPSNGCVPVNIFGRGNITSEAVSFIGVNGFENISRVEQHAASLSATGPVASLVAGEIMMSGGAEYRRNSAVFEPSEIFATSDTLGFTGTGPRVDGTIEVFEVFGETVVPIIGNSGISERLELEAGGRFSHYSTAGDIWTWKVGGQWLLFDGLRLRGMWQRAVRAPNIDELLRNASSSSVGLPAGSDFCLASNDPIGRGLANICIAQGMDPAVVGVYDLPPGSDPSVVFLPVTFTQSGNPNLEPERANTITAGIDYTFDLPFSLQIGAGYFAIKLENAIGEPEDPLGLCAIVRDPNSPLCQLLTRDASGAPIELTEQPINVALARVEGIDAHLTLNAPIGAGDLTLRTLATYYSKFGQATTVATPFIDCAGGFELRCAQSVGGSTFPDRLVTTTIGYDTDRIGASIRWRWVGGIENLTRVFDDIANFQRPPLVISSIRGRHYLDASIRFDVSNNVRLRVGADNLLATDPPLLASQQTQSNTDPSRYDVFGRRIYIGINVKLGG